MWNDAPNDIPNQADAWLLFIIMLVITEDQFQACSKKKSKGH